MFKQILYSGFTATLNLWFLLRWLWFCATEFFFHFAESFILAWSLSSRKKWSPSLFLRFEQLRPKYRFFFSGLSPCQGNLLRYNNDRILFSNNAVSYGAVPIFLNRVPSWLEPPQVACKSWFRFFHKGHQIHTSDGFTLLSNFSSVFLPWFGDLPVFSQPFFLLRKTLQKLFSD